VPYTYTRTFLSFQLPYQNQGFFNSNNIISGPDTGKHVNMPSGFVIGIGDMVPLMGGHAWDTSNQPSPSNPWEDPFWIMGPYDGTIVDYEPMIPLSFMVGNVDKFYEKDLAYVGQTMNDLPTKYSTTYV
jgi:hypothetical protein